MKKIYILAAFIIGITLNTKAQNFSKVTEYIEQGDFRHLATTLDEKVEVTILDNDTYTRKEAKSALNNFFLDKKNSIYKAIHKGKSANDSHYQIGELNVEDDSYRTYFYTKQVGDEFLVQEIRIEKQ